jgi:hypothetical protein
MSGTLAALATAVDTDGKPGAVMSGSTMAQAVLGTIWHSREAPPWHRPSSALSGSCKCSDLDIFCTARAAAVVRTALVADGYMLAGMPDSYTDNGNGSTFPLLQSAVHHVEGYAPLSALHEWYEGQAWYEDGEPDQKENLDRAYAFGADTSGYIKGRQDGKYGPPPNGCAFSYRASPDHEVKVLPGHKLPFDFEVGCGKAEIDLVVAETDVSDARRLLDDFDINICKCSFDGKVFRIPDPHLTFHRATTMEPNRKRIMLAVCKAVRRGGIAAPGPYCEEGFSWDAVRTIQSTGLFQQANIKWNAETERMASDDYDSEDFCRQEDSLREESSEFTH